MSILTLPPRLGPRPETRPENPHYQLTQEGPEWIREEMLKWMADAFADTRTADSEISLPGNTALFLDNIESAPGAVLLPPKLTAEFAHIHPDGSFHLALSPEDQEELITKSWGERHPLYGPGVNIMLVYSPRTVEERAVVRTVLEASYHYATGR